jgi:hypothetical protein
MSMTKFADVRSKVLAGERLTPTASISIRPKLI